MFGSLRFVLAMLVLYAHAWGQHGWSGGFAVLAFFTLSGYLMTLIVQEKYGTTVSGLQRFTINRVLRIFPAYWLTLTLTLLFIFGVAGDEFLAERVFASMHLPVDQGEWLPTLALFGQWAWLESKLVPQAWALNTELIYYVAIAVFIGRRREYALACLLTSVAYTAWICGQQLPFESRYFEPISGLLPFSLGAVIYFNRHHFTPSAVLRTVLVLLAIGHLFIYDPTEQDFVLNVPLYLNVALFGLAIWSLADLRPGPRLAAIDDWLGRMSYPIYLNHYLVIGLLLWYLPELPRFGPTTFLLVAGATLALSQCTWWLVERPVEVLRRRVALDQTHLPHSADRHASQ